MEVHSGQERTLNPFSHRGLSESINCNDKLTAPRCLRHSHLPKAFQPGARTLPSNFTPTSPPGSCSRPPKNS